MDAGTCTAESVLQICKSEITPQLEPVQYKLWYRQIMDYEKWRAP